MIPLYTKHPWSGAAMQSISSGMAYSETIMYNYDRQWIWQVIQGK